MDLDRGNAVRRSSKRTLSCLPPSPTLRVTNETPKGQFFPSLTPSNQGEAVFHWRRWHRPGRHSDFTASFEPRYDQRDFGLSSLHREKEQRQKLYTKLKNTHLRLKERIRLREEKKVTVSFIKKTFGIEFPIVERLKKPEIVLKKRALLMVKQRQEDQSARVIQHAWKRWKVKKLQNQLDSLMIHSAKTIQKHWRRYLSAKNTQKSHTVTEENAVLRIQKHWRGYL